MNWKKIDEFPKYEVSEDGNVRTIKGRKEKCTVINDVGYKIVILYKNNKQYAKRVHRLVGVCHIPNPKNYPVINHLDGDKLNNHKDNLEWTTRSKNIKHAYASGFVKKRRGLKQYRINY